MAETEALSARDVEQIMRLALKRNPHWFIHRSFVIVPPIDHFARGFRLDRFISSGTVTINSWIKALYEDGSSEGVTDIHGGEQLKGLGSAREAKRIADWVEEEFPRFGWICTPRTYLKYIGKMTGGGSVHYKSRLPTFSYAMVGELSRARLMAATTWQEGERDRTFHAELRAESAAEGGNWDLKSHYSLAWVRRMRRVLEVLRGGQAHADAMLEMFERINVRRLGLETHWTSPWPERRWRRGPQPT